MLAALILAGALGADWLLDPSAYVSSVKVSDGEVSLENGLVRRTIRMTPSPATVSLKNLVTGEELLRGISPEARISVAGTEYKVGGLEGQPIYNYLRPEWLDAMVAPTGGYSYVGMDEGPIEARFPCRLRREWMGRDLPWPPKGRHVRMRFRPPKPDLPEVDVHYEIYDGLPLLCKWLTIENRTSADIELDDFTVEEVRYAESGQYFDTEDGYLLRNFGVISDLKLQLESAPRATAVGYVFCKEPDYVTQMNRRPEDPWTMKVKPPAPPHLLLGAGKSLTSHRGWILAYDSKERERRGLSIRRAYRTLAPWTDENPLMFHLVSKVSPADIREGIRQCAETGFDTLIMSFWSDFNFESEDPAYRRQFRDLSREAKAKGVELGGYSLTGDRDAGDKADNVQNAHPVFRSVGPCLGSKWGMKYLEKLKSFMTEAEFGIFENDGPYPGDTCAATNHPGHRGLADSFWVQWQAQSDLYRFCRAHGVFVNQPDAYFLNGGNKTGMGFREHNWSLPREYHPVIERQNIFDCTWTKTTSMGWMFVPLSEYHGGGPKATIEPLEEHLAHYDLRFADNLGAGVQACWRGPRLFDSEKTLAMVRKWTKFYKTHRRVLTGDLIHLRRPDGRDWDGWLKVDPQADERAMAFLFNPTTAPIEREIRLPLYYAGLTERASVSVNGVAPTEVKLDRDCQATVRVTIPAEGYVWVLVKASPWGRSEVERETISASALISVKPHLQLMGETSVGVVWTTREKADGWVEWSQDGGATWHKAWNQRDGLKVEANDRVHKIVVEGYDPAKPLKYRVRSRAYASFGPYKVVHSGEEWTHEGGINAVLPADGTLSFAVFNDVHGYLETYPKLLGIKEATKGLSFTVFNGDIMSCVEDRESLERGLLGPLAYCAARTQAPMWYLRGNHETRGAYARHMRDHLALQNGRYYGAVTLGRTRFVFLDTGEDKTDDHATYSGLVDFEGYLAEQTAWLKREVESPAWKEAKFRVVFSHIPPDVRLMNKEIKLWKQPLPRIRALHDVLEHAGTTLVVGAHMHMRALRPSGDLHPYAQVAGGGTIRDWTGSYHEVTLTRCDIRDDRIVVRLFGSDGREIEKMEVLP